MSQAAAKRHHCLGHLVLLDLAAREMGGRLRDLRRYTHCFGSWVPVNHRHFLPLPTRSCHTLQ